MKIIVSNRAKEHMEAHKNDFVVDWNELLKKCEEKGEFNHLNKPFEILKIKFMFNIGYSNCIETEEDDEVIFAKRVCRDTYTRFVKNKSARLVNSAVFILNKNKYKSGEYYLVTMFGGEVSYKEPEDLNISCKEELNDCLSFWGNNALIYDESIIDKSSVKGYCPYKNLYISVA